ncbi:MAG: hypothetical protein AAGB93_03215 [Planctomycetota bacterium]
MTGRGGAASDGVDTSKIALAVGCMLTLATNQESKEPEPWGQDAREVQSSQIVAQDGRPILWRVVNHEQREDQVDVDFDLVDAKGTLLAWGRETVFTFELDGEAGVVRRFLLFDPDGNVAFTPIEGEPIVWFRQADWWGPVHAHEGLHAVRRAENGTFVIDSLGKHPRRTILRADDWSHGFIDLFWGDFTSVIGKPSEELLHRAHAERSR